MPLCEGRGVGLPRAGGRRTVLSGAAQEAGAIPPPGGAGEDPSAPGQPCSPRHEAALHLAGMRVRLDARSARRATRHATHRTQEAPRRLPTAHGRDEAPPAPAGAGMLPASERATARPRQVRRRARERSRAQPLFPWGEGRDVHMAQPAGRHAEEVHVGAVYARARSRQGRAPSYDGGPTSERVCLKARLCTAEARTTEEPDAEKLHVRDCTGMPGNRHSYRRGFRRDAWYDVGRHRIAAYHLKNSRLEVHALPGCHNEGKWA